MNVEIRNSQQDVCRILSMALLSDNDLEERFLKGDSQIGGPPGQPRNLSRLRKCRGSPVALAVTSSLIRLICELGSRAEFFKLQPNLHQSIAISHLS